MIIVLGGQKGGTGKSTIATNLAVVMAHQGSDVLLLDADPQLTATQWWARRMESAQSLPPIKSTQQVGVNLHQSLRDFADRYEHIVVDTGGHDGVGFRSGMLAAQQVILPLRASQADLETLVHVNEVLQGIRAMRPDQGPPARVVINSASTHYRNRELEMALEFIQEFDGIGCMTNNLCERKVFRDALIEGRGILEMENETAAEEFTKLFEEVMQ